MEFSIWAKFGQGSGKVWARFGESLGKVWAKFGQGSGKVQASSGYDWLPPATIDLVGDNREFEV